MLFIYVVYGVVQLVLYKCCCIDVDVYTLLFICCFINAVVCMRVADMLLEVCYCIDVVF